MKHDEKPWPLVKADETDEKAWKLLKDSVRSGIS